MKITFHATFRPLLIGPLLTRRYISPCRQPRPGRSGRMYRGTLHVCGNETGTRIAARDAYLPTSQSLSASSGRVTVKGHGGSLDNAFSIPERAAAAVAGDGDSDGDEAPGSLSLRETLHVRASWFDCLIIPSNGWGLVGRDDGVEGGGERDRTRERERGGKTGFGGDPRAGFVLRDADAWTGNGEWGKGSGQGWMDGRKEGAMSGVAGGNGGRSQFLGR